jgi:alpha-glucosidase (family GH31 glycosyl hydrolase)
LFEWRETFDNTKAMFDSLYALKIYKVGLHIRPRFDNGKKLRLLDEAQKKGFIFPEEGNTGEFINFFNQKAVDWWWENGVKRVADQGAMFLKTDEGSAFGHIANESKKTGPKGKEIACLHNLFPLVYAKAPFEKFAEYIQMRGMNQTREGYAGIQRYPYIFAGDWPSEWQYFEPVIKARLNMGISGVGNWSHCMGGFEHVANPELYLRWCQFGLLSPIAHLFGMEHPNYKEPWNYEEEALTIFKQYDQLRYSLIPYLYSYSYEMHKTGMPLMRALVLAYQNDSNFYSTTDQYLLGENRMICPVTTKGAKIRVVYLPEGNWIDYWTGKKLTGKQYINVVCPLDKLPNFLRAGAIIPTQEPLNYIGEKKISELTFDIYPSKNSSFTLYDDGKSLNYEKGDFSLTQIESFDTKQEKIISISSPKGNFKVAERNYTLKINLNKQASTIKVNNEIYLIRNEDNLNMQTAIYKEGVLTIKPDVKGENDISIAIKK